MSEEETQNTDLAKLCAALVRTVKDQQLQIEELKAEIKECKKSITYFR